MTPVAVSGQAPSPAQAGGQAYPEGRAHRAVLGRNGVVATADQLASLAGIRILMKGGSAVDATVAAAAALNVVEPFMSGMAGFGGFMLNRSRQAGAGTTTATTRDATWRAPSSG